MKTDYFYNYKDLFFITREGGEWFYRYRVESITKRLKLKTETKADVLKLGMLIGAKSQELIEKCKLEYGNNESNN